MIMKTNTESYCHISLLWYVSVLLTLNEGSAVLKPDAVLYLNYQHIGSRSRRIMILRPF